MLARMRVARGQPLWRRQVPLLFQGDFLGKCRWNHHSLVPFGNGESVATLQLGSYDDSSATPPLVLLGGTAQTINGWVGHHKQLSADRQFLQYELRGQGRTTLNLSDCSLKQHIADFEELVTRQLQIPTPVDLAGFSFGGRVALAIAAERPDLVHRLVLTGVPLDRGAEGRLTLKGWEAALRAGHLEAMMWQSVVASHASSFLATHEAKFPAWVKASMKANSVEGLHAILTQTHHDDPSDPFHPGQLAPRVGSKPVLLIGGLQDRISPPAEVGRLARALQSGGAQVTETFIDAGHMMAIEKPAEWRKAVLEFLA